MVTNPEPPVEWSRPTFRAAGRDANRWLLAGLAGVIASAVLGPGLALLLSIQLAAWTGPDRLRDSTAAQIAMMSAFVVFTWGPLLGSLWFCTRTAERILKCPQCGKGLAQKGLQSLALCTGRCRHCERPVFASDVEVPRESSEAGLVSRAELQRAEDIVLRIGLRSLRHWLIAGGLLLAAGGLGAWTLNSRWIAPLEDFEQRSARPLLVLLLLPGIAVAFWSLTRIGAGESRRTARCPGCGHPLGNGSLLLFTGNCPSCGQRAIADPLPLLIGEAEEAEPAWTVEQFCAPPRRRSPNLLPILAAVPPIAFLISLLMPLHRGTGDRPDDRRWYSDDGLSGC